MANQKDYKEIAKIIKNNKYSINEALYNASKENTVFITGYLKSNEVVANKLADYFEREDDLKYRGLRSVKHEFNREQFLKDCGVKNGV